MSSTTFRFDPVEHRYYVNDDERPSVTTVLREAGLYPATPFSTDKHRNRGSRIHQACELINQDPPAAWDPAEWSGTSPELLPPIEAYARFVIEKKFQAAYSEHQVYSQALNVAGTFDVLGKADGEWWLLDVKSGVPPAGAKLQLLLYKLLIEECLKITPARLFTLAVANGRPKLREVRTTAQERAIVIGACYAWWWRKENRIA